MSIESPAQEDECSQLRIAINASHAKTGGGVTYLRHMLPLLSAEPEASVHLILHKDQQALFEPVPDGVEIVAGNYGRSFFSTLLWEQCKLPGIARRLSADVLFSPANFGPVLALITPTRHRGLPRCGLSGPFQARRRTEGMHGVHK